MAKGQADQPKAPSPMPTRQNPVMAARSAGLPPPVLQRPQMAPQTPPSASMASAMMGAPKPSQASAAAAGQPGADPRVALQMLRRGNGY